MKVILFDGGDDIIKALAYCCKDMASAFDDGFVVLRRERMEDEDMCVKPKGALKFHVYLRSNHGNKTLPFSHCPFCGTEMSLGTEEELNV